MKPRLTMDAALTVAIASVFHRRGTRKLLATWLIAAATTPVSAPLWAQDTAQSAPLPSASRSASSPLPHAVTDLNFAAAVASVQAATFADGSRSAPLHLRYELKMVDVKGKQHAGTYETWETAAASRTEIHTDTYNAVDLIVKGVRWLKEDGIRPLRILEFVQEQVVPRDAVALSLKIGDSKMKQREVNGLSLICGGDEILALTCFERSSGFIAFATAQGELVQYATWRKLGPRYLPGVVRITRLNKPLVEATMTFASGAVAPEVFVVPEGAAESSASSPNANGAGQTQIIAPFEMHPIWPDGNNLGPDVSGKHQLLSRGAYGNLSPKNSGKAMVKVTVDQRGRVTKAVLEDADTIDVGDAALESARGSTYAPEKENGRPVGFQAAFYVSVLVAATVPNPAIGGVR